MFTSEFKSIRFFIVAQGLLNYLDESKWIIKLGVAK
jgi:hypothetical protein